MDACIFCCHSANSSFADGLVHVQFGNDSHTAVLPLELLKICHTAQLSREAPKAAAEGLGHTVLVREVSFIAFDIALCKQ